MSFRQLSPLKGKTMTIKLPIINRRLTVAIRQNVKKRKPKVDLLASEKQEMKILDARDQDNEGVTRGY
jgi:hypothetical protein